MSATTIAICFALPFCLWAIRWAVDRLAARHHRPVRAIQPVFGDHPLRSWEPR